MTQKNFTFFLIEMNQKTVLYVSAAESGYNDTLCIIRRIRTDQNKSEL